MSILSHRFIPVYIIIQLTTRICLIVYSIFHGQMLLTNLLKILTLGFINDFMSLIYILPIYVLFCSIKSKATRFFAYSIAIFIMIINLFSEICFWDEFGTRYNFIAVDYLIYTHEIIGTIRESLPILEISLSLIALSVFAIYLTYSKNQHAISYKMSIASSCVLCIPAFLAFKFYDPSITMLCNDNYEKELIKNGYYEFFSALRNNSLDYIKFYQSIDRNEAMNITRTNVIQQNQKFLNHEIKRETKSNKSNDKNYNIVIVVMESMGAEYMEYFGNTENLTPHLDSIAQNGILFNNLYATGTRTVRGLEAITLGTPPTPGASIVRQLHNDGLSNIGSILKSNGYDVNFIYGGFSYFDNLKQYFGSNGYRVIDRNDIDKEKITFENIWGVADEDIFNKSIEISDESYNNNRSFLSLIMTTSNHRPYTFPEGRIDRKSGSGRYAAVKYADYAVGSFIEKAKSKPWFDNTIFIITADHCASSAGKVNLPIEKYHIPLIIYAPKILQHKIIDNLASQIDIAPTILGLLNINYTSKFFGKDIINFPANRAFISTYQLLGYVKDGHLIILSPKNMLEIHQLNERLDIKNQLTVNDDLVKEAISLYQIPYLLFKERKMSATD